MFGETLFSVWAPPESIWTPWVKPVLFAQIETPPLEGPRDTEWRTMDVSWAPPLAQRTALIIDLPGEVPLLNGLALAHRGYRPVVLYNCCDGPNSVIDLSQCIVTLSSGINGLQATSLPADAPPAFLIDSRRNAGERQPTPGTFNNRWIVLPQDFPSASFLLSNRIEHVAVIQVQAGAPRDDVAHVLLRWQEAGIKISSGPLGQQPADVQVKRPWQFRYAWYALLATIGLRPNVAGGFGAKVPVPSQGGHG